MSKSIIPTIDISPLLAWRACDDDGKNASDPGSEARSVCGEIGRALETVGFFNAVGLGAEADKALEDLRRASRAFFALSPREKNEIAASKSPCYRGYSGVGEEKTNGRPDVKEGIDFGVHLDLTFPEGDPRARVMGRNQYPSSPPDFCRAVDTYMSVMAAVGGCLMAAVGVHLGLGADYFATRWAGSPAGAGGPCHLMRVLHYPPVPHAGSSADSDAGILRSEKGAAVQGIGEHSDYGALAILASDAPGLEALTCGGEWCQVPHVEGGWTVNVGDCLELWTGGRVRSTRHRVTRARGGSSGRLSFPFFFEPGFDTVVTAIEGLEPRDGFVPSMGKQPGFTYGQHIAEAFARSYPSHAQSAATKS